MLLRQHHKDLHGVGVQTLGISVDHLPALRVFDSALAQFPFPLAADWHRGICRQYGVLDEEKQTARRVLMLCDGELVVRQTIDNFDPTQPEPFLDLLRTAGTWQGLTPSAHELGQGPAPSAHRSLPS